MPQSFYDELYARALRRQQEEQAARASRRSLPSSRLGTPKRDIRSVSFSAKPLPGTITSEPGHRTASPVRSAIRSPSPDIRRAETTFATRRNELREYSDEALCEKLHDLRASIVDFAEHFFVTPAKHRKAAPLNALLANVSHRETVAFASRLLLGGPEGKKSWEEAFEADNVMYALVTGMVTQVLKDQVFDLLYFGATKAEQARLDQWQAGSGKLHGFERQRQLKELIEDISNKSNAVETQAAQRALASRILAQLFKLISPLLSLGAKRIVIKNKAEELLPELKDILEQAVSCANDMRRATGVAFEWTNVFKDFEFDPKLAECFNVAEMLEQSPYAKAANVGRAVLKPGEEHRSQSIIVGIVSPGLVCYRLGKPGSAPAPVIIDGQGRRLQKASSTGFQYRVIVKNAVLLRWGKQSLRTRCLGRPEDYEKALSRGEKDDAAVSLWDLFVEYHAGKT